MRSLWKEPLVEDIVKQICGSRGVAELLHMQVCACENGLQAVPSIGTRLLQGFVEAGCMFHAIKVFHGLTFQDSDAWSHLITGHVKQGDLQLALSLYRTMQASTLLIPEIHAWIALLRACTSRKDLKTGQDLYADISNNELLLNNVYIGSCLVDMFAKCNSVSKAEEIFSKLGVKNRVTWNALLTGYVENGYGEAALKCLDKMKQHNFPPDSVTYICGLKACSIVQDVVKGYQMHIEIVIDDLLDNNEFLGSSLIDMYANCGLLASAQDIFDEIDIQDVVAWNSLISGYAEHGCAAEALRYFDKMFSNSLSPTPVTFVCALKACSSTGLVMKGHYIHSDVVKHGLERELHVGSIVVDMYLKSGALSEAQSVFHHLKARDVISWTALISGCAEVGRGDEALSYYRKMQNEGICSDSVAVVCCLVACSSIAASERGFEVHNEISKRGLENDLKIGNALINMYTECGLLESACEVFEKLLNRDLVSWNAIIAGYAQVGESENVFHLFERALNEDLKPDLITFVSVLNACSHAGLIDKAYLYFEIIGNFLISPRIEHYSCMVDLLGRAGHTDKALTILKKMPFQPDIPLWHAVMGACRKWGNVEHGRHAFEEAVHLDVKNPSSYVCMFNIYADTMIDLRLTSQMS